MPINAVDFVPKDPIVMHLAPLAERRFDHREHHRPRPRALESGLSLVMTYAQCDDVAGVFGRAKVAALLRGLPFFQWAAVLSARCVVTVDTGATHVASAVRANRGFRTSVLPIKLVRVGAVRRAERVSKNPLIWRRVARRVPRRGRSAVRLLIENT